MGKRKNKEGSYGTVVINGYTYKQYTGPNGSYRIYAKTAKELEIKRKKKEEELKAQIPKAKILTITDLCKKWLSHIYQTVSPSTYDAYENIIKVRIEQYKDFDIGNKESPNVIPDMIERYLKSIAQKYSKGSVDKTWVVLKQALIYGQDNGYVPTTLNLQKIKIPTEYEVANKKKQVQFATLSDVEILTEEAYRKSSRKSYVYHDGARVLVFIMYSGLRVGEATGLKWKYIAADFSKIKIIESNRRVVKRDNDGNPIRLSDHNVYENIQKGTKTQSGERIIPLPIQAIEVLGHFDKAFPAHKPDDYVFLTEGGKPYDRRNLNHVLTRMMNNCECENKEYSLHSLRHGYGSILISQGVDIKTVSILLGHKDISTTYNIYIHVLEKDKEDAVKAVFEKKKKRE